MQQQEGPADGWDLRLDARRGPHQLHAERHPHAAMEVQLIGVVCFHLSDAEQIVPLCFTDSIGLYCTYALFMMLKHDLFSYFVSMELNTLTDTENLVVWGLNN